MLLLLLCLLLFFGLCNAWGDNNHIIDYYKNIYPTRGWKMDSIKSETHMFSFEKDVEGYDYIIFRNTLS